ncbi:MAG: hypothetical protein K9N23_15340 [Akkermansiaceae bacterium]|nr:hypothetical protein [Akkermansiaceae bacterium]MCF7733062.1 hypothetical protein [Akkermansiaceae bacterium]
MEQKLELPLDFKELIVLFLSHEVRFLVVGAYALGVHGQPRNTGDIDFWIEMSADNARKTVAALHEFFGPMPEIREENFLSADRMSQFGIEPMRVDILNAISGVEFADAFPRRSEINYSGINIPFISLSDLRANKLAAGRHKDLADLENLPNS